MTYAAYPVGEPTGVTVLPACVTELRASASLLERFGNRRLQPKANHRLQNNAGFGREQVQPMRAK